MKQLQFLTIAILAIALFAGASYAQKKPVKKPTTTPPAKTVPPLEVRVAREKVSIQLDNVNKFVDVLGPIAENIEALDTEAKTKPLTKTVADKNESNKQKVIQAIRNLKTGLATLESEFRTKPELKKYLPNIQGITDLTAKSEDLALAGQFVAAKEPLRDVSKKLTDTLSVMPQ